MSRSVVLPVRVTPDELELLDELCGGKPNRSEYVRLQLFGAVERTIQREAKPVEASAPIEEPPAPPAKELLILPPAGSADAKGWLYAYQPRNATSGTLVMLSIDARSHGQRMEVDLVGVELETQPDGSTHLRFSDRSLVRMTSGEGE